MSVAVSAQSAASSESAILRLKRSRLAQVLRQNQAPASTRQPDRSSLSRPAIVHIDLELTRRPIIYFRVRTHQGEEKGEVLQHPFFAKVELLRTLAPLIKVEREVGAKRRAPRPPQQSAAVANFKLAETAGAHPTATAKRRKRTK
jgi:hypothetical protein